jgi:hypothetical protein
MMREFLVSVCPGEYSHIREGMRGGYTILKLASVQSAQEIGG